MHLHIATCFADIEQRALDVAENAGGGDARQNGAGFFLVVSAFAVETNEIAGADDLKIEWHNDVSKIGVYLSGYGCSGAGASTLCHVESGSNAVMTFAVCPVSLPRSFW